MQQARLRGAGWGRMPSQAECIHISGHDLSQKVSLPSDQVEPGGVAVIDWNKDDHHVPVSGDRAVLYFGLPDERDYG